MASPWHCKLRVHGFGYAGVVAYTIINALQLLPAAAAGGFLGLSADQYGLYHQPSPALDSLHADYHFFHHHEMPAGTQTVLDGVASFASSAHVRVQPSLKPGGTNGVLSISLCGGDTVFELSLAVAAQRVCLAQAYQNNSNTAGWSAQTVQKSTNISEASPEWCRALCCANPVCSGWTYTDPQPGSPAQNDCWMQEGNTKVVPGGRACSGAPRSPTSTGHCWSGLGNSAGTGAWSATFNGAAVNASGRPIEMASDQNGLTPGFRQAPQIDILIDGSFAQMFFNGEVATVEHSGCSATAGANNATISVVGADAVLRLDTWRMQEDLQEQH